MEDGAPSSANLPLSTLQFNVYYHLTLAHYLLGNNIAALESSDNCLAVAQINDESITATVYWRWMILKRLHRNAEAAEALTKVHSGMRTIEGSAYLNLTLMFKGEISPDKVLPTSRRGDEKFPLDFATLGYGVGFYWYYIMNNRTAAINVWKNVLNSSEWSSFGYVASEAKLHELFGRHPK